MCGWNVQYSRSPINDYGPMLGLWRTGGPASIDDSMTSHPGHQPDDAPPLVAIVDDDQDVRQALQSLLRSVGLRVALFASVNDFVARDGQEVPHVLVLDVRLPGKSGLEFLHELGKSEVLCPVIFISGYGDIPMSVRAMKAGAVDFLTKPVRHQDLLDAIQAAVKDGRVRRDEAGDLRRTRENFAKLTTREREVMSLVVAGHRNKQIAVEIGISEATVKLHRGHVMRKTQAQSLADLIRMADKLRLADSERDS